MIILIKRAITFVIILLLGFFFYKIVLKGEKFSFFRKSRNRERKENGIQNMEKDPVCGTYVPEKVALKLKSGGELYYFCSDKCRDEYISFIKK